MQLTGYVHKSIWTLQINYKCNYIKEHERLQCMRNIVLFQIFFRWKYIFVLALVEVNDG